MKTFLVLSILTIPGGMYKHTLYKIIQNNVGTVSVYNSSEESTENRSCGTIQETSSTKTTELSRRSWKKEETQKLSNCLNSENTELLIHEVNRCQILQGTGMWNYETFICTRPSSTTSDGQIVLHGWLNMSSRQTGQHPFASHSNYAILFTLRADVKKGQYIHKDCKLKW